MEPAWERTTGKNFLLVNYQQVTGNGTIREFPEYQLTKTECLYIATKFNDETRAKLILRWEELEKQNSKPLTQAELILVQAQALVDMERKINSVEAKVDKIVKAQEDVMAQLEAIPLVDGEIPEQSARSKVNELVRHYSYISGVGYRGRFGIQSIRFFYTTTELMLAESKLLNQMRVSSIKQLELDI